MPDREMLAFPQASTIPQAITPEKTVWLGGGTFIILQYLQVCLVSVPYCGWRKSNLAPPYSTLYVPLELPCYADLRWYENSSIHCRSAVLLIFSQVKSISRDGEDCIGACHWVFKSTSRSIPTESGYCFLQNYLLL